MAADANAPITLKSFTVAGLPATVVTGAVEGAIAYATNGRKVGEGGGAGTGVPVYYSALPAPGWHVYATDALVAA